MIKNDDLERDGYHSGRNHSRSYKILFFSVLYKKKL
jgi:hypothetical protein